MKIPAIPVLLVASGLLFGCSDSADPGKANAGQKSTDASQESTDSDYQFSADKKDATRYTEKANKSVYDQLAFDDKTAYEDVDRGFIAPLLNDGVIKDTFDAPALNFMQDKDAPATVNPSLWRHAQLVNRGGLYKVTDHIYQVRGQDLVNLTIIETDSGIVLYDVEYTADTLAASIKLYEENRGNKPLKGVIISHSHADHFGGFDGIYKAGLAKKEDFASGKIPLIAPEGFVEESVSENVMAGNVMARRAGYQYGNVLEAGPKGKITAALGAALADGASSLPIPNTVITKDGETINLDGVDFEFYLTPDAEAPAEMIFYIREWKALSMAEELNHLQHNIYTLRGAKTRDASVWASYMSDALVRFGDEVEVNFGPHTWPVWGNDNVVEYLKNQRDLYQSMYNTVLRYANYGYGPDEIAESAQLPESVYNNWDNRPYYGHTKNNLKSTYIRNMGWFDGNAAKLATYPDDERGKRYVEAMGGEDKVLDMAVKSFEDGDYRFTADLLNNIVAYDGNNEKANFLMADALEQLGYQEENTLYRNLYLSGAYELRTGGSVPNELSTVSPEVIAALPPELFLSYISMIVDQIKAEEAGNFTINLKLDDKDEFALDMHNGVLNYATGHQYKEADATLSIAKLDMIGYVAGKAAIADMVDNGKAKVSGDSGVLDTLSGLFDTDIKNNMNLVLPLQEENRVQ